MFLLLIFSQFLLSGSDELDEDEYETDDSI